MGKGLSALIPGAQNDVSEEIRRELAQLSGIEPGEVAPIPLSRVRPNPFQPRRNFAEAELAELAASIREHGVIQPITVRKSADGYELISGERRVRAAKQAGLTDIPAYILAIDSDRKMLELAIVENVQRQDLNPIEEAESYRMLIDECGLKQDEVAERIAKDRTTVSNFLRILKLPDEIKDSLRHGELGMGHAKAIMSIPDMGMQITLWQVAVKEHYSVRKLEELARRTATNLHATNGVADRKRPGRPMRSVEDNGSYETILNQLKQRLATQIRVRPKNNNEGEIAIEYYSHDDLERLCDLLLSIRPE
jgi:ParB family transcriptional regulator, chromosome partitioning protein